MRRVLFTWHIQIFVISVSAVFVPGVHLWDLNTCSSSVLKCN